MKKFTEILIVSDIKKFYKEINTPTGFIDILPSDFVFDNYDKNQDCQVQIQFPFNEEDIEEYYKRKKNSSMIITTLEA